MPVSKAMNDQESKCICLMPRHLKDKQTDDETGTPSESKSNIQNKEEALEQNQDFLLVNSISPV